MYIARLPIVRVLVATTRCQYHAGLGPQVNNFEQVSSDDHQMSVARGGARVSTSNGGGWGSVKIAK